VRAIFPDTREGVILEGDWEVATTIRALGEDRDTNTTNILAAQATLAKHLLSIIRGRVGVPGELRVAYGPSAGAVVLRAVAELARSSADSSLN